MDTVQMTRLLLLEVEILIEEVASFVRSCCNSQLGSSHEDSVNVIDISQRLSQGVLDAKIAKLQVNDIAVIPSTYKETIFGPLQKKDLVILSILLKILIFVIEITFEFRTLWRLSNP